MKIDIKHVITGDVLFSHTVVGNTVAITLREASLHGADLRCADLRCATLCDANLYGANLRGANLRGANLRDANLRGADLNGVRALVFQNVPEEGSFIGWKKLQNGVIAKLKIPESARRTSTPIGRKNRAEFVEVLELFGAKEGVSMHDGRTKYIVGETVNPDSYDDDIRVECTNGIHFFVTRQEAENYC